MMSLRIYLLLQCSLLLQGAVHAADDRSVNVRSFEHRAKDGDWSRAIQAAIDSVDRENGYEAGGTVLFPAGTYRIDLFSQLFKLLSSRC